MKISNRTCLITTCLAALASPALAQDVDPEVADDVPPVSNAPDGQNAVMRGVQGPAGMFSVRALLGVNLSADLAGEPISLAPNLYYSVTDRLQVGLLHDGPMGWQTRPGTGLCLTGEDGGCPDVYNNIGFDAMYGLIFGRDLHLSAHGSFYVNSFDPSVTSMAVGAAGKAHFGERAALFFDPQVSIALSDRDAIDDALFLPIELQYQLSSPTTLKLLTGISGSLSEFGDTYQVPVGIGLMQNINQNIDIGVRFSFDNLLGETAEGVDRADTRSLAVLANLRL
jgi:opacity protein-like surface antigen